MSQTDVAVIIICIQFCVLLWSGYMYLTRPYRTATFARWIHIEPERRQAAVQYGPSYEPGHHYVTPMEVLKREAEVRARRMLADDVMDNYVTIRDVATIGGRFPDRREVIAEMLIVNPEKLKELGRG